jgi:hypothetical protein
MVISKRKENAQEVELIPVYNKRLRKSFFTSRNVRKPLAKSHGVSQQQAGYTQNIDSLR